MNTSRHAQSCSRDLGKIADGMKMQVSWRKKSFASTQRMTLTCSIGIGKDYDSDNLNAFFRNLPVRDKVTENGVQNAQLLRRDLSQDQCLVQAFELASVQFAHQSIPRVFLPDNYELHQDIFTKIFSAAIWPPQKELEPILEQAADLPKSPPLQPWLIKTSCVVHVQPEGSSSVGARSLNRRSEIRTKNLRHPARHGASSWNEDWRRSSSETDCS